MGHQLTPLYSYAIIRKDISIEQQIVQMAHAAHEAGSKFGEHQNLILLSCDNENEICEAAGLLKACSIEHSLFFESDIMEYTALCTEPIKDKRTRNLFKRWPLYKAS